MKRTTFAFPISHEIPYTCNNTCNLIGQRYKISHMFGKALHVLLETEQRENVYRIIFISLQTQYRIFYILYITYHLISVFMNINLVCKRKGLKNVAHLL